MTLAVDSPNYTLNNGTIVRPPLEQVLDALNAAGILTTADIDTLVPSYSTGTYAPTVTAGSGTFTSVSAAGHYAILGKLVWFSIAITITTNGTAATNVQATLPSGTASATAIYKAISNTGGAYYGATLPTEGIVTLRTDANTYPGGSGVTLAVSGSYLKA